MNVAEMCMCERDRQHCEVLGGGTLEKIEPEREGEKRTFEFSFLRKVSAKYFFGFISMQHGTNFTRFYV